MGTSAWLISRAAQHPSEASLTLAIVGVQFFGLSRGFFRYGERLVGHDAALRVLADLRVRVFERLEAVAPAGLPVFRRGDLVARFVDDVDSLQDVVLRVLQPFLVAILVGSGTVAVLWWFLPQAGVVLLVALLLSATAVPWLTGHLARREESRQATVRGELTVSVVDLVEGAPELLVMGAVGDQLARIDESDGRLCSVARHGAGTTGLGLGLTTALAGLASWGALTLGVAATHGGSLNGALLAVLALVPLAAFELASPLPAATQALQRSRVAAARVFEAMDAAPVVNDPPRPLTLGDGPHALTLRDVWADLPGRRARCATRRGPAAEPRPARRPGRTERRRQVNLGRCAGAVPAGRRRRGNARRAAHGTPRHGRRAAGRRVGRAESPSLRHDPGREPPGGATRGPPMPTSRPFSAASGWAPGWPGSLDGLATAVGQRGGRLSGGQRQRVAVARALLADFPILVLDEPGEHLEPPAADALTADLLTLTEGRSTLFITHRLTGLEQVDEILVLDAGQVAERGTHDELLVAGGRYADLWWEERLNDRPIPPCGRRRLP